MKICPNCKSGVDDDVRLCPNCNTFIAGTPVVLQQDLDKEGKSNLYSHLSIASFIMGICSFIILICLLLSIIFFKSKLSGFDQLIHYSLVIPGGASALISMIFSLIGIVKKSENKYYMKAIIGLVCGIFAFIINIICMFIFV